MGAFFILAFSLKMVGKILKFARKFIDLRVKQKILFEYELHCKYQRYILTRCSVNLLVVFNIMVLKRVFFVISDTCVALIWALMC